MKINLTPLLWINSLLFFIFLAGCKTNSNVKKAAVTDPVLPVAAIISTDKVLQRDYVADIQAVRNVELRARVAGFLEKIYVDEGQEVKKGQLLFKINDEEYRSELAKARANIKSALSEARTAELEISRLKLLVDKNVIAKTELDVARSKLDAVKARIEAARSAEANAAIKLSYTLIRAPFNGVIDRISLTSGSLVNQGTLLTTASDVSSVYAYFNVSEREYLEYAKTKTDKKTNNQDEVKLILADGSPYPHTGSIETMAGQFRANTGSIAFRAHFPNPNKILKHRATGSVSLSNTVKDALIVPQKAVFEIQDKNYVFVVDAANKVKMKNFVPQTRFSHYYIVASGLKAGERIVLEGIQNVQDGMQITPKPVSMDSTLILTKR